MPGQSTRGSQKIITPEELGRHNTAEDLWLAIDGHVYDLTKFAKLHPGGRVVLLPYAGKDATTIKGFEFALDEVEDIIASEPVFVSLYCVSSLIILTIDTIEGGVDRRTRAL